MLPADQPWLELDDAADQHHGVQPVQRCRHRNARGSVRSKHKVRAAARQQLPHRVAQQVGPPLRSATLVQTYEWLHSGIGVLDQQPATGP